MVIATLLGAEEYRLCDGAADRRRLHHDAEVPSQYLPRRHRDAGSRAAQEVHRASPNISSIIFFFVAEEVRQLMAKLGFRTINEMVGRVDKLKITKAVDHWKAKGLDLTPLLTIPDVGPEVPRYCVQKQDHGLDGILDNKLVELCQPAIDKGQKITLDLPIRNVNRTAGTLLSSRIAKKYGLEGLPEDTISIKFTGSAGQSFGAFLARGITLTLEGESNDYIGKGLSGGKIIVFPPKNRLVLSGGDDSDRQHVVLRRDAR